MSTEESLQVTAEDRAVGRPALLPTESPIEYGVRCIAWAEARIVEWLRNDVGKEGYVPGIVLAMERGAHRVK